ncbi:MAG: hypothetical protein JWM27_3658 [Gemmatimonadetes bacterium]|nr:hypothetical protein [Gemmatimonadota bacterium]
MTVQPSAPKPAPRANLVALRMLTTASALLFAGQVMRDPYTLHRDGGDVLLPAPLWHPALAVPDVALLLVLVLAVLAWRWRPRGVLVLLLAEAMLYVGTTLAYVHVDGVARFVRASPRIRGWRSTSRW